MKRFVEGTDRGQEGCARAKKYYAAWPVYRPLHPSFFESAFRVLVPPPTESSQRPDAWFALPKALPRSFDKILAQASDPFIGFHSGLFEERQCSFAGADGLQVAERIHDELQRG